MKGFSNLRVYAYKVLLFLLWILIYLKRLFIWGLRGLIFCVDKLHDLYLHSIAFRVYKVKFWANRLYQRYKIPLDTRLIDTLTKRGSLELLFLGMVALCMFPYTTLYSHDRVDTAGKGTLLYSLLGPADHDYALDDVSIEQINVLTRPVETPSWKAGAVSTEDAIDTQKMAAQIPVPDVASISFGSAAVHKQAILPGTDPLIPIEEAIEQTGRRDVIEYVVQSGDTISGIAEKHRISLATVLWANNLSARSYIRPGQTVKILPVSGVVHTVKSGDTVSRIAQLYNAEKEDIVGFNRLQRDGSDIRIGEQLVIPDGEKPAPPRPKPRPVSAPVPTPRRVAAPPALTADGGYIWPAAVRIVTQGYGWRHNGLDIAGANAMGTPLYASQSGIVSRSQCNRTGYGCYIMVDHAGGVQTLYAHASQLLVTVGEPVVRGQTIGLMGSTGNSTGPHVHFEVRINGRNVNPYQYVK